MISPEPDQLEDSCSSHDARVEEHRDHPAHDLARLLALDAPLSDPLGGEELVDDGGNEDEVDSGTFADRDERRRNPKSTHTHQCRAK